MVDERGEGQGVQRLLSSDALVQRLPLWGQAGDGSAQGLWTAGAGAGRPGKGGRLPSLGRGRPVWVGLRAWGVVRGGRSLG
eukprot:458716-Rhodomonas_salina.3